MVMGSNGIVKVFVGISFDHDDWCNSRTILSNGQANYGVESCIFMLTTVIVSWNLLVREFQASGLP